MRFYEPRVRGWHGFREPLRNEETIMGIRRDAIATITIALTAGLAPAAGSPAPSLNGSGYEYLLGADCTLNGSAGRSGVAFGGWTGGGGPVANGWKPIPGDDQGMWKATLNYIGKAAFGGAVSLQGGSFDLLFTNDTRISANITGGTVTWPVQNRDIGCGVDVAKVSVYLAYTHGRSGPGLLLACLHDLPAGSVIPPKIWGALR
jgi:hypothetical protein